MTASFRQQVQKLVEQGDGSPIRGPWHHYQCVSCGKPGHMGVNVQTWHVHCLRCGFSCDIPTRASERPVLTQKATGGTSMPTLYSEAKEDGDEPVRKYMESRGVVAGAGRWWAYGRKTAKGCPVFLSRNADYEVVYLQWRKPNPAGGSRYMSSSPGPRLDMSMVCRNEAPIRNLLLVEGPMDAMRVRQSFPVWTCCNFGVSLKPTILRDIARLSGQGIEHVVVWFDAEPLAYAASTRVATMISGECGIAAVAKRWPNVKTGTDQCSAPQDLLVKEMSELWKP